MTEFKKGFFSKFDDNRESNSEALLHKANMEEETFYNQIIHKALDELIIERNSNNPRPRALICKGQELI
jgi:hypothetical protein